MINTRRSWCAAIFVLCFAPICAAQKDPGARGGPPGAGGPIPGLTTNELALLAKENCLRPSSKPFATTAVTSRWGPIPGRIRTWRL